MGRDGEKKKNGRLLRLRKNHASSRWAIVAGADHTGGRPSVDGGLVCTGRELPQKRQVDPSVRVALRVGNGEGLESITLRLLAETGAVGNGDLMERVRRGGIKGEVGPSQFAGQVGKFFANLLNEASGQLVGTIV